MYRIKGTKKGTSFSKTENGTVKSTIILITQNVKGYTVFSIFKPGFLKWRTTL